VRARPSPTCPAPLRARLGFGPPSPVCPTSLAPRRCPALAGDRVDARWPRQPVIAPCASGCLLLLLWLCRRAACLRCPPLSGGGCGMGVRAALCGDGAFFRRRRSFLLLLCVVSPAALAVLAREFRPPPPTLRPAPGPPVCSRLRPRCWLPYRCRRSRPAVAALSPPRGLLRAPGPLLRSCASAPVCFSLSPPAPGRGWPVPCAAAPALGRPFLPGRAAASAPAPASPASALAPPSLPSPAGAPTAGGGAVPLVRWPAAQVAACWWPLPCPSAVGRCLARCRPAVRSPRPPVARPPAGVGLGAPPGPVQPLVPFACRCPPFACASLLRPASVARPLPLAGGRLGARRAAAVACALAGAWPASSLVSRPPGRGCRGGAGAASGRADASFRPLGGLSSMP